MSEQNYGNSFNITGKVLNINNQKGIPDIIVKAYDKDLLFDDALGDAITDTDGTFSMEFPEERYRDGFLEELPDLYFKLYRPNESEPAWTTEDSVIWNATSPAAVNIELDLPVDEEPEPKPGKPRQFVGRLINGQSKQPLNGLTVRAFDLDAGPEPRALGYAITGGQGLFTVHYTTPADTPETAQWRFRLDISASGAVTIYSTVIAVPVSQAEVVEVEVPTDVLPKPSQFPIEGLKLDLPQKLLDFFILLNISSLQDIRRAGGIAQLIAQQEELQVLLDDPAVKALDAQAALSVLSSDVMVNKQLIESGFDSLGKIARSTRAEFVTALHAQIGDVQAACLYAKACAQTNYLNNMLAWRRAEAARGACQ